MKGRIHKGAMILVCPCEQWQLEIDTKFMLGLHPEVARDLVEEAIREHENECVVLAATHIAAQAVRS